MNEGNARFSSAAPWPLSEAWARSGTQWRRLTAFLHGVGPTFRWVSRHPRAAMAAALALVLLAGWADYLSGPDLSLSLLYLIPIVLAGWLGGCGAAWIVAGAATAAWLAADLAWRPPSAAAISVWNGLTRLVIFSFVGQAVARLQSSRLHEREQSAHSLQASDERYHRLFMEMLNGFALHEILCDEDGRPCDYRFLEVNPAFERLTGLKAGDVLGRTVREVLPDLEPEWIERLGRVALTGESVRFEQYSGPLDRHYDVTAFSPRPGQFAATFNDITEHKRLEEQLAQAQKMEAIGRLAGGVAHDFNNMLTAILGGAELGLESLGPDAPAREDIEDIRAAATRAADLTGQLLAFSRQQVLQPCVLDLNRAIAGMERMLRRLIGEDVALKTVLAADLGRVRVDPTRLEQVIVNLAVNGRDAMPDGGRLLIETSNVELDAAYTGMHMGVSPGPCVMLAITDTGCGMDAATKARIFEPFFTRKEKGRGTGLGLASVYGFVRQSGGNIWVYSEPGHGTTFKLYLPRIEAEVETPDRLPRAAVARGSEVVLVAEDADEVRSILRKSLEAYGYQVLEAESPEAVLGLARTHQGSIHLLVTDVVMPGMSGRALAERVTEVRPGIRVLYVSGYTSNAIVHHGVLDEGVFFLQKPFTPEALARRVRETLDAG